MGRPRVASDAEIFAATLRAVTRLGPARLTLADVAREVGLSAAALVKRFGSKRDLLLAVVSHAPETADECFAAARRAHRSPLAALIAAATSMADHVGSPDELANSVAFLHIDLTDADFRRPALANSKRVLAGYAALIREAVDAGELAPCDPRRVARAIEAVTGGSMINWAIHREGSLAAFLRRDVGTLLAPLRAKPARRPAR